MNKALVLIVAIAIGVPSIGCGVAVRSVNRAVHSVADSGLFHRGRAGALNARERAWALAAWRYFDVNLQASTGLVGSLEKASSVTMWQVADYLAALVAARELKFIDGAQFDERFRRVIHFLNITELYDGRVPNRAYSAQSWKPLTAAGKEGQQGWSSIDLGRLLIWLRIARDRYPQYSEYIDKAVVRWNFCDVIDADGALYGGLRIDGRTKVYQEGRLGYEEYAAAGFRMWGFRPDRAAALEPSAHLIVNGISLPVDARDPRTTGVAAPIVTMPSVLLGLELDWRDRADLPDQDKPLETIADRVYQVQEARYRREQIYTARTDHPISRPPYFVYDSIASGGYPFNTTGDDDSQQPTASLVSTRAVFGMWALWNTDYTTKLMSVIESLNRKDRGWFEGRFEQSGGAEELITSSTNAVVLEALLYKTSGPLFKANPRQGYFDVVVGSEFGRPAHCLPESGPAAEIRR
jgi:hypothetical protein